MRTDAEQRAWEAHASGLPAKLLAVLERHTQAQGLQYAAPPAQLGGGFWASLYAFRLERAPESLSGELVLRVMPTADEDGAREAILQSAVASGGFPAPRVCLSGGRNAGLGFPFIVMQRAAGSMLAGPLWRIPVVLAETMARLHALDDRPVAAGLARAGRDPDAVGLDALLNDLAERGRSLSEEGFAAGAAWLESHRPAPARRAVCHGDLHPYNLLVAHGEVSGLLDWTQALLADPAFDVAYTSLLLRLWPVRVALVPRWLGRALGARGARRFLAAYRARSNGPVGTLDWYEALHAFRILARVARARAGITVPPLARTHPWELIADDAARAFRARTGVRVVLPAR